MLQKYNPLWVVSKDRQGMRYSTLQDIGCISAHCYSMPHNSKQWYFTVRISSTWHYWNRSKVNRPQVANVFLADKPHRSLKEAKKRAELGIFALLINKIVGINIDSYRYV